MRIINYCDICLRKSVCNIHLNSITPSPKFDNIIIDCTCRSFRLPCGTSYGHNIITTDRRSFFNHCNDCNFAKYCKYYENKEMLEKIKSISNALTKNENISIEITCNMHESKYQQQQNENNKLSKYSHVDTGVSDNTEKVDISDNAETKNRLIHKIITLFKK